MSTSRRTRRDEGGFSLIEIVVTMGLIATVLTASVPMFVSLLRSTLTTRLSTQAKNLTQERLEHVRDLRFHVDRQNGEFLDLLDIYYTNAKSAGTLTGPLNVGGQMLTGSYVATGGGTGGEPAAPYYRVTTGQLSGATDFSQVITAQFLSADGRTVLSDAPFVNQYDSQVVGRDDPPTLMLGVTVITNWTESGKPKTYRTYTQVTETRPELPVIQSQARSVAVDLSSTAQDSSTLRLQGGVASIDGAQSSGSFVSGLVSGAVATRTGAAPVEARTTQFLYPSDGAVTRGNASPSLTSGCTSSWYAFGNSSTDNADGSVVDGLPKAPSNIDANPDNRARGLLNATGSVGCGLLEFHNVIDAGIPRSGAAGLMLGATPHALVPDGTSGAGAINAGAYVTATALTAPTQQTKAGADAFMDRPLHLFPNSPDAVAGQGLVSVQLSRARVDCVSGTSVTLGTVAASYELILRWRGRADPDGDLDGDGVIDVPITTYEARYDYDTSRSTPLAISGDSWNPTAYFLSDGSPLSNYVLGDLPAAVSAGETTGTRGFPSGVITLTTASTLQNEPGLGFSAIKAQLGQLTCVADDQR